MNEPRNPSGFLRQHRHLQAQLWPLYEQRKQEWIAEHPEATPTAYEAEMKRIARECGV